jgi:hypothetical protein
MTAMIAYLCDREPVFRRLRLCGLIGAVVFGKATVQDGIQVLSYETDYSQMSA